MAMVGLYVYLFFIGLRLRLVVNYDNEKRLTTEPTNDKPNKLNNDGLVYWYEHSKIKIKYTCMLAPKFKGKCYMLVG